MQKEAIKALPYDIKSGITVFLVAIPLCLGISLASGAPLMSGLVAGIIGGTVVGYLSGSRLSVSGPAAGLVSVVLAAITTLGSFEAFLLCVIIAGIIQLVIGFLRMGIIAHYVPQAVIKGMLAAIGVILIIKQTPIALGYNNSSELMESFLDFNGKGNTLSDFFYSLNHFSIGVIIITVISFLCLYIFNLPAIKNNKFLKFLPGSLVAIIVAIILNNMFKGIFPSFELTHNQLVYVPNVDLDNLHNVLIFPDFSQLTNPTVYKYGIIIAIIASIETLLSIEAIDKLDPQKHITPTNRELKAQGVGNIISGFLGGLPVTSVIIRSSVNVENNAQTKNSAIIHGFLLLSGLLTASFLMNEIPLAALAVILISTGYKLVNEKLLKEMYKRGLSQLIPFITTLLGVFFSNILTGVCLGLIVSMFFILKRYYELQNFQISDENEDKKRITFSEYTSFLSKANIQKTLKNTIKDKNVILDLSNSLNMDDEVKEVIKDLIINTRLKDYSIKTIDPNNILELKN